MQYLMLISLVLSLVTFCLLLNNIYMIMFKVPLEIIIKRRIHKLIVEKAKKEEMLNILHEQECTIKVQNKIDKIVDEIGIISCKLVVLNEYINKKPSDC